jgi:hypothetical protein
MLFALLVLCRCGASFFLPANRSPLNINAITDTINKLSVNGEAGSQRVRRNGLIIDFQPLNKNGEVFYAINNLKSGKLIYIQGNPASGYIQKTFNKDSPKVDIRTYFGDGKIKSIGRLHIDSVHQTTMFACSADIEYPEGTIEYYSHDGKLINIVDYSKIFLFSYNDLVALLKEKYNVTKIKSIKGYLQKNGKTWWFVNYESSSEGLSDLRLDARDGHVIYEAHHIQLIE